MKLPLRYDPQMGLMDADGLLVADLEWSSFELDQDDEHGVALARAMNCHEALLGVLGHLEDAVAMWEPCQADDDSPSPHEHFRSFDIDAARAAIARART